MAERGSDRLGLCLKTAVLSVCSLFLLMFPFPRCRLIIDPARSVGRSQRDRVRLRLEAGAGQRLVTAWSRYPAWWYAVCVELFVSKGEKATEVECWDRGTHTTSHIIISFRLGPGLSRRIPGICGQLFPSLLYLLFCFLAMFLNFRCSSYVCFVAGLFSECWLW